MLLILIIVDSIYTSHIVKLGAEEANQLILWAMNTFNWTLDTAMVMRIFFCMPFLYILNRWDWSRFTLFCYLGIYILLTGMQDLI